jgi:hypothetical protein
VNAVPFTKVNESESLYNELQKNMKSDLAVVINFVSVLVESAWAFQNWLKVITVPPFAHYRLFGARLGFIR